MRLLAGRQAAGSDDGDTGYSCKYHALYLQYIHGRIAALGHDFTLCVLLVLVDV